MKRTDTIIIGGGQAGLAMSRCLTELGVEHVILERGRIGQAWAERWDSLRLLSPNWMTRLPGWRYQGPDPDGYMTRDEVRSFLEAYARTFDAPVHEETSVLRVDHAGDRFRVITDQGSWIARSVVIATGHCNTTSVPAFAGELAPEIVQITTSGYRNPGQLPPGGVLVVGASASGIQLARELRESGREVVLAVGRHTRLPRRYRGRDILYWLDRLGTLNRARSDVTNPEEAAREESLQLIGSDRGETVDLALLAARGVRLAGRLTGLDGTRALFADDLAASTAAADDQLVRILGRIDRHIDAHGLAGSLPPPEPFPAVPVEGAPLELDLVREGIESVLWATGYRRTYRWLHVPVLGPDGEIRQHRGRTEVPGLYALGLQFMIRRNSSFLDGVGRDAEELAAEIARRSAGSREEAA